MAKDKQIQELEIQVSATGVKAAEAKIARLEKKKAKWEKDFKSMRAGKTAREKEFRDYRTLNRKEIWEQEFRKKRAGKIAREEIAIEKHRVSALKKSIMERTGKSKGGGFASLDKYRKNTLLERRQRGWSQQFQEMRAGETVREAQANKFQAMRSKIGAETPVQRSRLSTMSERLASRLNNTFNKTSKALKDRIKIEKTVKKVTSDSNKEIKKSTKNQTGGAGRRSGGGIVGKAMLYLGLGTMVQYMAGSAFQGAMALGDATANVEADVLKGKAFQERYRQTVGDTGFNDAVALYSRLSGQSSFLARSQMAQIAGSLEAAGVTLKGEQLTGVARATRGLAGGMGISEDMASQKILGLLSGRISAQEAGLVGVKRSSDPSKTLDNILKFMEKNAVTASVMEEGTAAAIMARIRTAPMGLIAGLYEEAPTQMKSGMNVIADWITDFTDIGNKEVEDAWGGAMAQFEQAAKTIFGGGAEEASVRLATVVAAGIRTIELAAIGTKNTIDVITMGGDLISTKIETQRIIDANEHMKEIKARLDAGEKVDSTEFKLEDRRSGGEVLLDVFGGGVESLFTSMGKSILGGLRFVDTKIGEHDEAFGNIIPEGNRSGITPAGGGDIIIHTPAIFIDKENSIMEADNIMNHGGVIEW